MFLSSIRIAVVALVVFSVSACSAELEAPLGLQWGQTQQQLKAKGVEFIFCLPNPSGLGKNCFTKNPPKPLSFAETYLLTFYPGLQQVLVGSKHFVDDPYGIEGKKQFADLKRLLIAKYGKPYHSDEAAGAKLHDESDEFYKCLADDDCGSWKAIWEIGDADITLELKGIKREGVVYIIYKAKDDRQLLNEAKAREAAADDAGL